MLKKLCVCVYITWHCSKWFIAWSYSDFSVSALGENLSCKAWYLMDKDEREYITPTHLPLPHSQAHYSHFINSLSMYTHVIHTVYLNPLSPSLVPLFLSLSIPNSSYLFLALSMSSLELCSFFLNFSILFISSYSNQYRVKVTQAPTNKITLTQPQGITTTATTQAYHQIKP